MPGCAAAEWIRAKIEDTVTTRLIDLRASQRSASNIQTAISCAGFAINSPVLRLGPLVYGTRYAGAAPSLRSRQTALTSCAGANGLVTRTLLGTPSERQFAAPTPVT